jgi:triosephosphate isomerase
MTAALGPAARPPLIVANWKMNGIGADLAGARRIADVLRSRPPPARVAMCVPATLIERLARAVEGSGLIVGGEDVHPEPDGAHTGDISAAMLADAGARMVIVGHSERRQAYGETDPVVAHKALAAIRGGLEPIICVGETQAERDGGHALDVVRRQARASIPALAPGAVFALAYEPVWAIGGDRTPTPDQIQAMHAMLRHVLDELGAARARSQVIYGGSVEAANIHAILRLADVDGALVGRASLSPEGFIEILDAVGGSR